MPPTPRKTLVVLGMMGRCPFGGQTWLYLNWLRGLAKLGHEVWYVEDDATWPYDPRANVITDDPAYAVEYLARVMAGVGLPGRWAFLRLSHPGASTTLFWGPLRHCLPSGGRGD